MSATENQLENASSSCERWEWACASFVAAAVAAEFLIAWVHPPYNSFIERWGSVLADLIITAGIVGEVIFSRKDSRIQTALRKRSNDKLGAAEKAAEEARERAAKLEIEAADARGRVADIERITAWRHITEKQRENVAASIRNVLSEVDLLVEYERGDAEAWSYGREIIAIFEAAGVTKIREIPNSYLNGPIFGAHMAAAPGINAAFISDAFNKEHLSIPVFQKDLSTHLSRNEVAPNLYIFVAPKPPPLLWVAPDADPNDPSNRTPTNNPANAVYAKRPRK